MCSSLDDSHEKKYYATHWIIWYKRTWKNILCLQRNRINTIKMKLWMRLLIKGEDNNNNREEEKKKENACKCITYIYCKQLRFYTWHNKFTTECKFDGLPYFLLIFNV